MENLKTFEIVKLLIGEWKKLLLVAFIAAGVSILISSPLCMTPDYKSEFVVYPTNLLPFSKESGIEQLFQFFSSEELKASLDKRFELTKHYGIDTNDKKAHSKFNQQYTTNIQLKFTRFQSLDVSVIDVSPEFAQKLANGMIEEANELIRKRKKEKYTEYIELYTAQLNAKKNEIDSLETKLKFMRITYGLLDVASQSKIMSKKMGKKDFNAEDKELLNSLKEHGGEFTILQNRFTSELENYKNLKQSYDKNVLDLKAHLTYMTVVSYPDLPDKNSPNRFLILVFITLSSLALYSLMILTKRKIK